MTKSELSNNIIPHGAFASSEFCNAVGFKIFEYLFRRESNVPMIIEGDNSLNRRDYPGLGEYLENFIHLPSIPVETEFIPSLLGQITIFIYYFNLYDH